MKQYWKIAIPKPINELFTYFTNYDTPINIVGSRVLVPFGRNNQTLTGIVVKEYVLCFNEDNSNNKPFANVQKSKEILEIIDSTPSLSSNMLKFISWISEYYLSPIGETFRVAIPAGISPKTIIKIIPNREKSAAALQSIYQSNPTRAKIISFLLSEVNGHSVEYLGRILDISNIQYHINYLLEHGLIFFEQKEKRIFAKYVKAVKLSNRIIEDDDFRKITFDNLDKKASKQSEMLMFLLMQNRKKAVPILFSEVSKVFANYNPIIKSLEKKSIVEIIEIEIDRNKTNQNSVEKLSSVNESLLSLTDEQQHCVKEISKSLDDNNFSIFLLHGVTGSGKTLIYLHTIKKTIELNKSVLILVPEISLTPQLIDRFNNVFPNMISVIHSSISDGERYDAWRAVLLGKTKIVLGARSALFSPLSNLGLIIVDEEHENSYKQDNQIPYYQARDAAIMRAKIENCPIVLGSATPSLESYYNAIQKKYKLLEIKNRADNAKMPNIQIVDMISARKNGQVVGDFSRGLIDKIKEKLSKKEGIILFQNKRGFASHLKCPDCGFIPQCVHCSVSLTYHQTTNELRCHYCGYSIKYNKTCEVCGAAEMKLVGSGTQRIEEQLNSILQNEGTKCIIDRLDTDTTRKKGTHRNILQKFSKGETDILLGTQMVAKGLDFDRVTLVGVINADIQLMLPDFRSAERTFQLLSQVAGRAGRRGNISGEVIIQTSLQSKYAIEKVKNNDYLGFFNIEWSKRKETSFPPFVRFCIIEFMGNNEEKVYQQANVYFSIFLNIIQQANEKFKNSIEFFTPQAPLISKLNDRYRVQISVKNNKTIDPQGKYLRAALMNASKAYSQNHSTSLVNVRIDIDTYSSL
jgi:primosomal protein N' (replication factor Y)